MTDIATATATDTAAAIAHFERKLRYETDPSDVRWAQLAGENLLLVDSRGDAAWAQGRAAGAVHLPTAQIAARATAEIAAGTEVIVYCWSPGCNGSTKAALEFARLGYTVREMIGGFEYWAREGYPVLDDNGPIHRNVDELTGPRDAINCDC
ncbi:MAG: rhodanese-like domain-containing protein [Rhodoglobus sp.]